MPPHRRHRTRASSAAAWALETGQHSRSTYHSGLAVPSSHHSSARSGSCRAHRARLRDAEFSDGRGAQSERKKGRGEQSRGECGGRGARRCRDSPRSPPPLVFPSPRRVPSPFPQGRGAAPAARPMRGVWSREPCSVAARVRPRRAQACLRVRPPVRRSARRLGACLLFRHRRLAAATTTAAQQQRRIARRWSRPPKRWRTCWWRLGCRSAVLRSGRRWCAS